MPNRAERRAQAKRNRRGVPQQYDQTQGRARSGMLDEYQLQEKSRRLQDGTDGPWKPSASTITETENVLNTNPDYKNPKMFKAPQSESRPKRNSRLITKTMESGETTRSICLTAFSIGF